AFAVVYLLSLHAALPILGVGADPSAGADHPHGAAVRGATLVDSGDGGGAGGHPAVQLWPAVLVPAVVPGGAADPGRPAGLSAVRSEEHTSELQSRENLVC